MRLLAVMVVILAGLLSIPGPREALAAPVAIAAPELAQALNSGAIENVYWHRGRYYRYRHRGMYFRHRYYRGGRWRYY